ncbi:NADH dehydrogenase 1 alpha subcomplex subunit 6 [Mayamaea pseudoterrestris]|nr:NADH dehydrogenase 1 alpha subcomplex subunit 6 [Mayamaea pseudoterrestris]
MTSLQLAHKARDLVVKNRPATLYKQIAREVPRVMQIFDIVHMGEREVKDAVRKHFYAYKDIKDQRVIDMLLYLGYNNLEDTLLQHKQKNHLMLLLEDPIGTEFNNKRLSPDASEEEQFMRWVQ